MDLIDQLRVLASRIASTKAMIQTEEATKNAMVMPFIQALGYNVFDPLEVTPELVADVGIEALGMKGFILMTTSKPCCWMANGLFSTGTVGCIDPFNHTSTNANCKVCI